MRSERSIQDIRTIEGDLAGTVSSLLHVYELDCTSLDGKVEEYFFHMITEHRFDVLGSGWIQWNYHDHIGPLRSDDLGSEEASFSYDHRIREYLDHIIPTQCLSKSLQIWGYIDRNYSPVDWQLDAKSGIRWESRKWTGGGVAIPAQSGTDIKVPWELGRFHHAVHLVLIALRLPVYKDRCIREFKNQVLDFIATNPPSFGVHWTCTMEVAIRAVNLLIAYDCFRQIDDSSILGKEFHAIVRDALFIHGKFIYTHLELDEARPNNHYLSDISGLLFLSTYLSGIDDTKKWRRFALRSFLKEVRNQFNEDGSLSEFSTSYHRFCAEMVIYTAAVVLGNEELFSHNPSARREDVFPDWFAGTVKKMMEFSADCTKPDGEVIQVGDNDNGRFIPLTPVGKFVTTTLAEYEGYRHHYYTSSGNFWVENHTNHGSFLAAGEELIGSRRHGTDLFFPLERSFIRSLSKGKKLGSSAAVPETAPRWPAVKGIDKKGFQYHRCTELPFHRSLMPRELEAVRHTAYNDIGIVIFRSDIFFLSVVSGPQGLKKYGSHAHDDFGSFELFLEDKLYTRDPGSYLYTSDIEMRNLFRSRDAHCGVYSKEVSMPYWRGGLRGLFEFYDSSGYGINTHSDTSVEIFRKQKNTVLVRSFRVEPVKLIVEDYSNYPMAEYVPFPYYSPGYGQLITDV